MKVVELTMEVTPQWNKEQCAVQWLWQVTRQQTAGGWVVVAAGLRGSREDGIVNARRALRQYEAYLALPKFEETVKVVAE